MERLTVNVAGATRRAELMGRPHLVAPMTMIVADTVLHGSRGPLLYERGEVARNVAAWNHMPIVLRHPERSSGRTAEALNKSGLGVVLNATVDRKGLGAEAWFDIERTTGVAPGVIEAIERGEKVELSTGLGVSVVDQRGVANSGDEYIGKARNFEPDHLAIFNDGERGACSVGDGCGVNNQQPSDKADVSPEKAKKILEDGDVDGKPLSGAQKRMFGAIAGKAKNRSEDMSKNQENGTTPSRDELLENLVTNCGCEREEVEALDDKAIGVLQKVANAKAKGADKQAESEKKSSGAPAKNKKQDKPPATLEEWLAANNAPDELRELVDNDKYIRQIIENERTELIDNIRQNPHNQLNHEDLTGMDIELLRKLEASTPPSQAEQIRRGPPSYLASAVANRQPTRKPKPLGLPEWDFAPAKSDK